MFRPRSRTASRPPRITRSVTRSVTHAAALAALLAASTALGACRASTPTPGGKGDEAAAPPGTLDAAAAGAAGAASTPTIAPHLTADDEAAMVALIRSLFGPAVGSAEPDMQDVVVRQVSTTQLSTLRGTEGPSEGVVGYSAGYVWIVGFKTSAPLTLSTFLSDAATQFELADIDPTASLAGPDGLTSVYYIVATQSIEGDRRFVPRSQGVLVAGKSKWSLEDLARLPATP